MHGISFRGFILLTVLLLTGCSDPGRIVGPQGEGAWLGEGTFQAGPGSLEVKGQLELLSDGTYRFLVLEPPLLMALGVESGTWTRTDHQLDLTPTKDQTGSGIAAIAEVPKTFRPKSLTIEKGNAAMNLHDGPMNLRFVPNAEATKKLREQGEVE